MSRRAAGGGRRAAGGGRRAAGGGRRDAAFVKAGVLNDALGAVSDMSGSFGASPVARIHISQRMAARPRIAGERAAPAAVVLVNSETVIPSAGA
ncbi:hypothetical protein [Actinophytocola sp.]|uniref:hypothetical protein n=1 Tax=Actinophytocola sp. TaxID=1872138 RepID=UPI002ED68525